MISGSMFNDLWSMFHDLWSMFHDLRSTFHDLPGPGRSLGLQQ
jgi:hypothetical protein